MQIIDNANNQRRERGESESWKSYLDYRLMNLEVQTTPEAAAEPLVPTSYFACPHVFTVPVVAKHEANTV